MHYVFYYFKLNLKKILSIYILKFNKKNDFIFIFITNFLSTKILIVK